jgi:hypothetical protein
MLATLVRLLLSPETQSAVGYNVDEVMGLTVLSRGSSK